MSDEKKSEMSMETMQQMIAEMMKQNAGLQGSSRRRGGNLKIKSVLVPVKVTERRDSCRLYLDCEADINSVDDVLELLFSVEDAGFDVNWWPQKQDFNNRRR